MRKGVFLSESSAYLVIVLLVASVVIMNFELMDSGQITGLAAEGEPLKIPSNQKIQDSAANAPIQNINSTSGK